MATETIKLTGTEAIEAFVAARKDGEGVWVWAYSPNGAYGGPAGENSWGPDEYVTSILEGVAGDLDPDTTEFKFNPADRSLEVSCVRERGVHQYYTLSYRPTPDAGRARVAYGGAHAGFVWEDESVESEALKTLLEYLQWDNADLAEFGLASCEDYDCGDDGGYWLVADAERFAEVTAKCSGLSDRFDDLEADDVLAFLRDGTEPDAE